ncbi:nickel ABC transporter substrate-binding protein [Lachnospiraceae bacterium CLA-AA-H215]|uniref:Nickel ABC transporter substrate-binding protein n=1 Tax=Hominifimenecus microfluidus TaxID=2885348 RepID=A0AAE3E8D8_9FIRM|nr:nickel ABC transporter substrate-binding protein [Hominifimenecus microfluidus]MCC2229920.1 nickel ABC transporter substrate-binding protein [Hominifimenecus microfluidus]
MKKRLSILLAVCMLAGALAGCGASKEESAAGEATTTEENAGEEETEAPVFVTIASGVDIGDMNPHLANAAIFAQNYVYEGLVVYEDGGIQPGLAETWDISEDGLTYTFHLRENAMYSDGTALTAENVVKNFDAIFAANLYGYMGAAAYMDHYTAVDEHTFEIVLTEPYAPVLHDLAAVRPFRMLGDAGFMEDGSTDQGIKEIVGTGPWMLTDYVENEYATFEQNPYYWGEAPKIDGFTLKVFTDGQTAVSALEAGEIDMIYDMYESQLMSVDTYNSLVDAGYNSFISEPVLTRALTLNSQVEPLNDFNVRKALILALDRESIVQSVFGGLEEMAQSYYWPGTMDCNVGLKGYSYNVEEANKLLDEDGWVLEDGKEYRTKDGKELAVTFYYDASNVVQTSFAQICQSEVKKIGMNMKIMGEEYSANISRIYSGEFEIGYTVSWGDPYDPHSTLAAMATVGGSAEYFALASMENFDDFAAKVAAAPKAVDAEERQALYKEIMQAIEDEYSIIPISYQTNRAITQTNISGVTFGLSNIMPLNELTVE